VVTLILSFVAAGAAAQDYYDEGYGDELFIGFSYSLAIPQGETRDFVADTGFQGLTVDWRKGVASRMTLGFQLGWNRIEETSDEPVTLPDGSANGPNTRVLNAIPILINAHYYWGEAERIHPYAGGGIGAYSINRRVEIGDERITDKRWGFGLAPEAGVVFPLGQDFDWFVNTRFNWALGTGDRPSETYWSVNIGFASETYGF